MSRVNVLAAICMASASVAPGQTTDAVDVRSALDAAANQMNLGDPDRALAELGKVEAVEPRNPWLHYLRGLAHHQLGEPYQAMESFDRAAEELLALGSPDAELSSAIEAAREKSRRQVFSLSLRLGLFYDSNVTFSGGGTTGEFISGEEDGRFGTRVQLDFAPIKNRMEELAWGLRLTDVWNFSVEDYNEQDYGGYVRYTRRFEERWSADFVYDYDSYLLGNDSFLSNHGLSPRLNYHWPIRDSEIRLDTTSLAYRIEARDFLFETASELDRDGFANSLEVTQSVHLGRGLDRNRFNELFAGYRVEYVATQGTEFDRLGNSVFVEFALPLVNPLLPDRECTLNLHADWQFDDYRNDSVYDFKGRKREDVITSVMAVLSQQVFHEARRGELIFHAILGWSDYESNVETADLGHPFDYDKIVAGFQIEWRF